MASSREVGHVNDVEGLPSYSNLVSGFATMKQCAHGSNCIPVQAYRTAPQELADLYYPIHLKSAITGHEPLQYKGAVQHEIRKPKVAIDNRTKAFRGVGIEDNDAKVLHKGNRSILNPRYTTSSRSTARGGLPKRGIDFAFQIVSGMQRVSANARVNTAVLFVDEVFAFDSTDRGLLFTG